MRVVNGGRVRANAPLLDAVTSERVGLAAADVALSEMGKVKPLLNPDPEILGWVWESYLMVAEDGDLRRIRSSGPR